MSNQSRLFKAGYCCLYIIMGIYLQVASVYASPSRSKSKNQGEIVGAAKSNLVDNSEMQGADEQDFDKIRKFESYDPATGLWSAIEDFKTVEILEDTTQKREDKYIYYNFWAYDSDKKRWYKVNIREYGYRYRLGSEQTSTENEAEDGDEDQEQDRAWKKLNLNLSVGGGGIWYEHRPQGLKLIVRKNDYMLQSPADEAIKKGHVIQWFKNRYKKVRIVDHYVVYGKQSKEVVPMDQDFSLRGIGVSIPITATLHYTFFDRIRLGLGGNFEINYLEKLKLTGAASHLPAYILPQAWFFNVKWFGLLGYKIKLQPTSAIIMDTQLGIVYEAGALPKKLWPVNVMSYLYSSWYVNSGIGYEKKLNRYLKFTTRLSGDYKNYDDSKQFAQKSTVNLYHIGAHLDVGLSVNFVKDTDGEENLDEEES